MTSIVFPGQGSQIKGMAQDFYNNYDIAKNVFQIVENATNLNISEIIFDNSDNLLDITKYTQLAIFTSSMAIFEVFKNRYDFKNINYVLGHSLGEYSALVASKSLTISECSNLLKIRGELMQNAFENNLSGMAAVLGLNCSEVEEIIKNNSLDIEVANDNAPGQVVISGIIENIKKSENILKDMGAKKIIYLNVSAAFHSKLMKDAEKEMEKYLLKAEIKDAVFPIISNYSAIPNTKKNLIFDNLSLQMSNRVRWRESIEYLAKKKESKIIEIGPGKVLTGIIKRISSDFKIININHVNDLEDFKDEL